MRIRLNALSLFLLFLPLAAFAAPPLAAKTPVSITVSGGVSLGSYQAGYLYYMHEFLRRNGLDYPLKGVTGASAGAINSLLSVLSSCSTRSDLNSGPTDSLFWKSWIPVGFKDLQGTEARRRPSAAFTMEVLEKTAAEIEKVWREGLREDCDVVFGIATTLLKPEQVSLGDGVQAVHQEQSFVLRIQGQGPGKIPRITNYVDPSDRAPHAMLYLPADPIARFRSFRDLLLASASFPGAFPPRRLKYCQSDAAHPVKDCDGAQFREELFIDGGVFDNQPIRLAIRNATRGLVRASDGSFQWEEAPRLKRQYPPAELLFRSVDVESRTYAPASLGDETLGSEEFDPILVYLRKFLTRFVATARSQQLYSVLEENPNFPNSIASSKIHYPLASEPSLAFFGFFDRGFREFDFQMGMHDARKNALEFFRSRPESSFLFPEAEAASNGGMRADWAPLRCLMAKLDHRAEFERDCAEPSLRNFEILLQLSLNRLYSNCSSLVSDPTKWNRYSNPYCQRAARGESPPMVFPGAKTENWKREPNLDEAIYSLRILYENDYRFELLKDPNEPSSHILRELRAEFYDAFGSLADRQPESDRLMMRFAGEPAFNLISYLPAPREYHLLLGELVEAGGSLALSDWFRAHAAFTVQRPQDVFSDDYGRLSFGPFAGLEFEPRPLSSAWVQPRIGTRLGWRFAPHENWGESRWAIEPYLAATIYQRVRLQFVERVMPASRGLATETDSFLQLGFELTP